MSSTIDYDTLKRGEFAPPRPGDLRSPCPAINALSNHGYVPRDGRNVHYNHIMEGMKEYGLGDFLRLIFSWPIFLEHHEKSYWSTVSWWTVLRSPAAYILASFGMRTPGQKDSKDVPCLNLDQLALHNVIEHDVSMTRLDFAQGDNLSPQPHLIADLLASSKDGKVITIDDFVALRKRRYEKQIADNPTLEFKGEQIQVACSEISLVLNVFGDGKEVRLDYVKAFFHEGRIPRQEGWLKRVWWTLGYVEMNRVATTIRRRLGTPGDSGAPIVKVAH